jgi:hypothetical protein
MAVVPASGSNNILHFNQLNLKKMKHFLIMAITLVFLTVYAACNKNMHMIVHSGDAKGSVTAPTGSIDVTACGATPNDTTIDNAGFQKAIDSASKLGGATVWVPAGTYMINVDISVLLKSNVIISMASGAILQAHKTGTDRNYVLKALKVGHIQILGGEIIGDRNTHTDTTGEHGMGIAIYGCDSVAVKYTTIRDCWGDGITMSSRPSEGAPNASTRIYIIGVTSDSNRRQGITIGTVSGVTIDSCTITHTNGTAPQDGIDIEPDSGTARNVNIKHSFFAYNTGNGIEMNAKDTTVDSIYNINVNDDNFHLNAYAGYLQKVKNSTFNYDSIAAQRYHPYVVLHNYSNVDTIPLYYY